MKKYVWLTLFLMGALFLVYLMFFTFHKNVDNNSLNTWNNITWNIENKVAVNESYDIANENLYQWEQQDSQNNDTIVNTPEKENDNELVIWNITLYRTDDNRYDNIFELLWVSELPKYKIEWKDIYVKKLDSVDYETEKVNIGQLIQKIWWNIAEVHWFWDKQLFVNLDPYYKKDSISLVEYNGNLYYMVLPYDKYYEYKKVIKEFLFNK